MALAEAEPILVATLAAEGALAGLLALGLGTGLPFWPPPRVPSWQWWMAAMLKAAALSGLVLLGLLGWGTVGIPDPVRGLPAISLMVIGEGLAVWAVWTLGLGNAVGEMEKVVTGGPYRFLRHPEYVGEVGLLVGWLLVSAAPGVALGLPLLLVCLGLAAGTEERALLRRFPADYSVHLRNYRGLLGSGGWRAPDRVSERSVDPGPHR